ncbi:MAG: hypothetical protein SW833_02705 [Cyanobacteriota bacterium]|nr:hypothetical protein [Cyanobacteriota bacterium]
MNKFFENKLEGLRNSLEKWKQSSYFYVISKEAMGKEDWKRGEKFVIFCLLFSSLASETKGVFAYSEMPESEPNFRVQEPREPWENGISGLRGKGDREVLEPRHREALEPRHRAPDRHETEPNSFNLTESLPPSPTRTHFLPMTTLGDRDLDEQLNGARQNEHLPTVELNSELLERDLQTAQREGVIDPELGILRLEEVEKNTTPTQPSIYLLGGVGYFRSDNIFSELDPIDEGLFRGSITLLGLHNFSPQTTIFGAMVGSTIRYQEFSQLDYNQLSLNAGISQRLFEGTYGELGWNNQQLFEREGDARFLNDHSAYIQLRRQDAIAPSLALNTSYLLSLSFAEPDTRSQTTHELGASLVYSPYTSFQVALDYDFVLADFRNVDRSDRYHQLLARLTYNFSPRSRLELFGGSSFGGSSEPNLDFNTLIFGVGLGFTLF